MYSPRVSAFSPVAPASSSHPTSFASVTDPTIHRHGWRSPRARPDDPHPAPRMIPSRFRSLLRYDALSPSPVLASASANSRGRGATTRPPSSFSSPPRSARVDPPAEDEADGGSPASSKRTNLDELTWFQHRWLDKHGKNSHLKEYREKLALLRRWFESLDADGSGEVGLDELEDPLVSVGLARSRDEVQRLIDQVDKDGSGEVTFTEFLRMMNPEKPKRSRQRQPLHKAKPRPVDGEAGHPNNAGTDPNAHRRLGTASRHGEPLACGGRRKSSVAAKVAPGALGPSSNPVVKLFEDLQSGKLGDLAIPFPVLITAYRRRMLLNAHMADDATARRVGTSVLQALESTRREASLHAAPETSAVVGHRRGSVVTSSPSSPSPSSYLKSYISTAEVAAQETSRSASVSAGSTSSSVHLPSLS